MSSSCAYAWGSCVVLGTPPAGAAPPLEGWAGGPGRTVEKSVVAVPSMDPNKAGQSLAPGRAIVTLFLFAGFEWPISCLSGSPLQGQAAALSFWAGWNPWTAWKACAVCFQKSLLGPAIIRPMRQSRSPGHMEVQMGAKSGGPIVMKGGVWLMQFHDPAVNHRSHSHCFHGIQCKAW